MQGEQFCATCRGERKRLRVYMSFTNRKGWLCQFFEEYPKTPLPKRVIVNCRTRPGRSRNAGRCRAMNLESLRALEHGIEIGRGGVWLELTEEHYEKLREKP